jgi:hypothetical protein
MRENRDGLVETPRQFRYVAMMLGISSQVGGRIDADGAYGTSSDNAVSDGVAAVSTAGAAGAGACARESSGTDSL